MSIKNSDRLIFAVDVPEVEQAKDLVTQLGSSVDFFKIGMELMMTGDYFELLDWLVERDKKVFVDLPESTLMVSAFCGRCCDAWTYTFGAFQSRITSAGQRKHLEQQLHIVSLG